MDLENDLFFQIHFPIKVNNHIQHYVTVKSKTNHPIAICIECHGLDEFDYLDQLRGYGEISNGWFTLEGNVKVNCQNDSCIHKRD